MMGNEIKPALNGSLEFRISFLIIQYSSTLTPPLKIGDTNQEATIVPNVIQLKPNVPLATKENPTVAPTILCVVDTGTRKKVATANQMAQPAKKNNKSHQ
jgi:hypothetical protein